MVSDTGTTSTSVFTICLYVLLCLFSINRSLFSTATCYDNFMFLTKPCIYMFKFFKIHRLESFLLQPTYHIMIINAIAEANFYENNNEKTRPFPTGFS